MGRRFGVFLSSLFTVNTDKPCCWWLYWPAGPMWTARLWYPGSVQFMPSLFFCAFGPPFFLCMVARPHVLVLVYSILVPVGVVSAYGAPPLFRLRAQLLSVQLHASQETIVTGVLG